MESLKELLKPFLTLFGYLLVLAISSLDTFTSRDISRSLFYLLPIILIAWFEGGLPSIMISIFSAINGAMSDLLSGTIYANSSIPIWNATTMLGMFLIVTYSITTVKKQFLKEHEHAHTDDLTVGIV